LGFIKILGVFDMVYNNNEAKDVIEVTNIAKVSRGDFNKSAEVKFYIQSGDVADLKVCQYTDKNSACECSKINLIIVINNLGPHIAQNVVLADVLTNSDDIEIHTINVSKGAYSYENGILTWSVGNISLIESPIAVIEIIPKKPGKYTSTAIATGNERDLDLTNNFSEVDICVRNCKCKSNFNCIEEKFVLYVLIVLAICLVSFRDG